MVLYLLLLMIPLSVCADSTANPSRSGIEAGYQGAVAYHANYQAGYQPANQDNTISKNLFYLQPSYQYSFDQGEDADPALVDFHFKARGWVDTQPNPGPWIKDLSIRQFSLSVRKEQWRVVAGFQEIVWGETFGFPILDIVSPRDYRDPLLLTDLSWSRLPVASIQGQLLLGKVTLQAVVTPFARSNLYPAGLPSMGDLSGPEFGGRASYLFEGGLDLGVLFYEHGNRLPLVPVEQKVKTLGASFSYALEAFVLRGDAAYQWDQPLIETQLSQTLWNGKQFQSALGVDYTSSEEWVAGVQLQNQLDQFGDDHRGLYWGSTRVSRRFSAGKFETALFFFKGLNNADLWFQPKVTWNVTEHSSVSLRGDILGTPSDPNSGYLWALQNQSRLFLWLTMRV